MGCFADKVVLITGGTSGMGYATADRMLREGASVVITGRSDERLSAAANRLGAGDRVLTVRADSSRLSDIDELMARIGARFGRLDVLFANAGAGMFKPVTEFGEQEFDHLVDVNFKGVFFTIQKALGLMGDGGSIVLNASWTTHRGIGSASLYSATKAAVQSLAKTLAADLAPRGIRVNSISPGYVNTDMFNEDQLGAEGAAARRAQVALGRFGRAEEVAEVVMFLASAAASYMTGQDLLVDGGLVPVIPN